ncbi:protein of unknown function [Burkholderia multivorans]
MFDRVDDLFCLLTRLLQRRKSVIRCRCLAVDACRFPSAFIGCLSCRLIDVLIFHDCGHSVIRFVILNGACFIRVRHIKYSVDSMVYFMPLRSVMSQAAFLSGAYSCDKPNTLYQTRIGIQLAANAARIRQVAIKSLPHNSVSK